MCFWDQTTDLGIQDFYPDIKFIKIYLRIFGEKTRKSWNNQRIWLSLWERKCKIICSLEKSIFALKKIIQKFSSKKKSCKFLSSVLRMLFSSGDFSFAAILTFEPWIPGTVRCKKRKKNCAEEKNRENPSFCRDLFFLLDLFFPL